MSDKTSLYEQFEFRDIRPEEADAASVIEHICFPPNEACARERIAERTVSAPDLFLAAANRKTGKIVGFVNGIATNETVFRDEFFLDISLHDPEGSNVMILSVAVLPEYQKQGLARALVREYCQREKEKGRKRLVLTCLDEKIKMYEKFGFYDLGVSASDWGGEQWHEMDLLLKNKG